MQTKIFFNNYSDQMQPYKEIEKSQTISNKLQQCLRIGTYVTKIVQHAHVVWLIICYSTIS